MSGKSKRKNKGRPRLEELPPEIIEKADRIARLILAMAPKGTKNIIMEEQEAEREELERILEDMLHKDPQELSEYLSEKEFLGALISALYYAKKIATSRPTKPDSRLILMYLRTIDAIAASIIQMINNAKGIILERATQIKQSTIMREDPLEELDRLETIIVLLEGLKKHIKNIIDEADT